MQAFLQPTLLFLTSLAHQSMSGGAPGLYSPYNPYAAAMMASASMYQPQRSYAPAYPRGAFRRPVLRGRPPFFYGQPQHPAAGYYRPSRPLYDPAVQQYGFYPGQAGPAVPQILVISPEMAQQALQQQRQIFVYMPQQQQQALQQAMQAFVHPHQQTENQVVSRAVPVPQTQLLTAHHQQQMMAHHHQQTPEPSAFTVGSSYSFQNQELGKQIQHNKK